MFKLILHLFLRRANRSCPLYFGKLFSRVAVVSCVSFAVAAESLFAGVDTSFDWPDNKRKLSVKVANGDTALGDVKLIDAVKKAIENLNECKDETNWEWEFVTTDDADICIDINDNPGSPNGGAEATGFSDKNADGFLNNGLRISFDSTPQSGTRANPSNFEWGSTGAGKMDPVSVAMHELLHTARCDHMANSDGKTGGVGDYFNPIAPGEQHTMRKLSQEDKTTMRTASNSPGEKDKKNIIGALGQSFEIPGKVKVDVTPGAILQEFPPQGEISVQHLTSLTVPNRTLVSNGEEILDDASIIFGTQIFFDPDHHFNVFGGFDEGIQIELTYDDDAVFDSEYGEIVDESELEPFVYWPDEDQWLPIGDPELMVDPETNTAVFGFPTLQAEFFVNGQSTPNEPLIIGLGGRVEPLTPITIDSLSEMIRSGENDLRFDLNSDGLLNQGDREFFVEVVNNTYVGDTDFDGEFNSNDLIRIFQSGEYEDGILGNSTWSEGDWTGDGEFDTQDILFAFQRGAYEAGPRTATAVAVPEPSMIVSYLIGLFCIASRYRRVA